MHCLLSMDCDVQICCHSQHTYVQSVWQLRNWSQAARLGIMLWAGCWAFQNPNQRSFISRTNEEQKSLFISSSTKRDILSGEYFLVYDFLHEESIGKPNSGFPQAFLWLHYNSSAAVPFTSYFHSSVPATFKISLLKKHTEIFLQQNVKHNDPLRVVRHDGPVIIRKLRFVEPQITPRLRWKHQFLYSLWW